MEVKEMEVEVERCSLRLRGFILKGLTYSI